MTDQAQLLEAVRGKIDPARLVQTAIQLIEVPSPTGQAGAVSDRLAELLTADGFKVERPSGGHPDSPAVVVRHESGKPGPTLQFDGHLDTVHLPFVPPRVDGDLIHGSGASDMKGGVAAAIEALRALRDARALPAGSILFMAHDLHEAPWGDGRQLDQLIREGLVGDAVLIPEPFTDLLAITGRGSATWKVTLRRSGAPVHEVHRPADEPSVIAVGAELVSRLGRLQEQLSLETDPYCGAASVFIGQFHSGEIYNQYPQECWLQGTRRWLPGTEAGKVEQSFRDLLQELARDTQVQVECDWMMIRDAFQLDPRDRLVDAFQASFAAGSGTNLPIGGKKFVDDGNSFWAIGQVPSITHGPRSGGAHTVEEWVSIQDLVRVAEVYAATAIRYCQPQS